MPLEKPDYPLRIRVPVLLSGRLQPYLKIRSHLGQRLPPLLSLRAPALVYLRLAFPLRLFALPATDATRPHLWFGGDAGAIPADEDSAAAFRKSGMSRVGMMPPFR